MVVGDERRAHRREGVVTLAAEELAVVELGVAGTDVVDRGVTGHVLPGVGGVDVLAGPADHDAELDLVVDLLDALGVDDGVVGVRDGGRRLPEQDRSLRYLLVLLLGVVVVVEADADDLVGPGDRRQRLDVRDRHRTVGGRREFVLDHVEERGLGQPRERHVVAHSVERDDFVVSPDAPLGFALRDVPDELRRASVPRPDGK